MDKKSRGYKAEDRACVYLQQQGYTLKEKNYTIRGGEIDLIMRDKDILVFVEVKKVFSDTSLHDYITTHKMAHLLKTSQYYLWSTGRTGEYRRDFVFVSDHSINHFIAPDL